ncbi:MAG TPA: DUF1684 domain-containing protein [Beijerinckiaceae bacterium]|jgi:uncharacterized protein (DUF1684 family)
MDDATVAETARKVQHLRDRLDLWDWRQRVFALYAAIRVAEPEEGWSLWRAERDALFRDHPQTPLPPERLAVFAGLTHFPYDPALRFTVDLVPIEADEPFTLDVGGDGTLRLRPFARTRGLNEALGAELTLYWLQGYGGGVFLPFRDSTAGDETYAGGRYLLDTIKGADLGRAPDGQVILDFNFAYNPSCSYSDRWVCPLSPAENNLAVPVRGGERA